MEDQFRVSTVGHAACFELDVHSGSSWHLLGRHSGSAHRHRSQAIRRFTSLSQRPSQQNTPSVNPQARTNLPHRRHPVSPTFCFHFSHGPLFDHCAGNLGRTFVTASHWARNLPERGLGSSAIGPARRCHGGPRPFLSRRRLRRTRWRIIPSHRELRSGSAEMTLGWNVGTGR